MTETDEAPLLRRVAGSALNLVGRRAGILLISALSTAVVARGLGPTGYGQLASALAVWAIVLSASDIGFSLVLTRDLAVEARQGSLLRAAYQTQGVWAVVLTLVVVVLALVDGFGTTRGQCLLVLAPSVLGVAVAGGRQVFVALYRSGELVVIDLGVQIVQFAATAGAILAVAGPVLVATIVSVGSLVNMLTVGYAARRHVPLEPTTRVVRRRLLRRVVPLGGVGFMSKAYMTLDLVLLGWLVSGPALGEYAVAVKVYSVLITIPALITSAALPALATMLESATGFAAVTTRVWHWLLIVAMPLFVVAGVFAPLAVSALAGGAYGDAVPLLRIMAVVGVVSVISNLLGTILVARHMIRPLVIQNALAIALNVAGNVAFVPRYGVEAAAWTTLATELFVVGGALAVLGRSLPLAEWRSVSLRPLGALGATLAAGLVFSPWPIAGAALTALAFVVAVSLLRAWPPELVLSRWSPSRPFRFSP